MSKLTAKKVENTAPRKKEYKFHDGGGLFLRVRPSGAKSWLFSFSLPNDPRLIRMTIGSVRNISLKEARKLLPDLRKLVAQGIDPRKVRAVKKSLVPTTKNKIICLLEQTDFDEIVLAFKVIGWDKPRSIYENYFNEQLKNIRTVLVVKERGKFCGYVTLKWKSNYHPFAQQNIPEISDLNVIPAYRNQGIGAALIHACETMARENGYTYIGLGVGMTADYGNAQRLYVRLGYFPDGRGLHYKYAPLNYGDQTLVDDDLVIFMTKSLVP